MEGGVPTIVLAATNGDGDDDEPITCTNLTEVPTGAFQVDCTCEVSGIVTVNFNGGFTQGTCEQTGGGDGITLSIDTTGTSTYTNCVVEDCDENVTLNGSDSFSVQGNFSECTEEATFTNMVQTAQACSGVTATTDGGNSTIGYDITSTGTSTLSFVLAQTNGDDEDIDISGDFCIGSDSITFSSATDFVDKVDPNNLCEDDGS